MEKLFILWVLCCIAYFVYTEIRDSGFTAMVFLAAVAGAAAGILSTFLVVGVHQAISFLLWG